MEKINLYLPVPLLKRLRTQARRDGVTVAEVIRLRLRASYSDKPKK
jgi:hypothetical protein